MSPRKNRHRRDEIETLEELRAHLDLGQGLAGLVVQALDLGAAPPLERVDVAGTIFLGCAFRDRAQELALVQRGAAVFPAFTGLPYDPYRGALYTVEELLDGFADGYTATRDFRIYAHSDRERRHPLGVSIREGLAQRLHDHGIDDSLQELLEAHSGRGVVGVMGGHGTGRSDPSFREVARATWDLTRRGYLVASGGGPGIMEAANLGAWLAPYADPAVIDAAIEVLAPADRFDGGQREGTPEYLQAIREYFARGQGVLTRFGSGAPDAGVARRFARERAEPGLSLAVPTWFYGHEPTNLFASFVAKYFSNSIREDGLLAISTAGVIYAPGSAGTLQEVFMDLAQNHYATFSTRSAMVFLGRERYRRVFELLQEFVAERGATELYGDLLGLVDRAEEAVAFLEAHPPRPAPETTPLYELLP